MALSFGGYTEVMGYEDIPSMAAMGKAGGAIDGGGGA